MSTIWITGGKGFIGRHLARFVSGQGNRVSGIGHGLWPIEDAGTWGYVTWSNSEIDAANLSQLARVSGAPDIVYHLAGGSSVGASFQNPHEDFVRTVESTSRLLEWLRLNAPVARVVSVSSAAVYGAGHTGPIPESAATSPYSPYGSHKAMMESLCRSYSVDFGLRIAMVRLFSVYGPGLEKQLIWDMCCKLAAARGKQVVLGGTGLEARDWLHVSDAAVLLWFARDACSDGCRVINGGTGIGTKVCDAAAIVLRGWGDSPAIAFSGVAREGDPESLVADIKRAVQLGFKVAVQHEEGILNTVAWFKNHRGLP